MLSAQKKQDRILHCVEQLLAADKPPAAASDKPPAADATSSYSTQNTAPRFQVTDSALDVRLAPTYGGGEHGGGAGRVASSITVMCSGITFASTVPVLPAANENGALLGLPINGGRDSCGDDVASGDCGVSGSGCSSTARGGGSCSGVIVGGSSDDVGGNLGKVFVLMAVEVIAVLVQMTMLMVAVVAVLAAAAASFWRAQ
jgi:hypothetical protein